jgi:hypothetical protein
LYFLLFASSLLEPAKSIFLPYLVTSFIERKLSPMLLTQPSEYAPKKYDSLLAFLFI